MTEFEKLKALAEAVAYVPPGVEVHWMKAEPGEARFGFCAVAPGKFEGVVEVGNGSFARVGPVWTDPRPAIEYARKAGWGD